LDLENRVTVNKLIDVNPLFGGDFSGELTIPPSETNFIAKRKCQQERKSDIRRPDRILK